MVVRSSEAPRVRVEAVELYERDVGLRLPFRFGIVTLTEAPQAFARVRVRAGGVTAWGAAAEVLAPKWFDKDPSLSNEENFEQLRSALSMAREAYLGAAPDTAFGRFAGYYQELAGAARAADLNMLTAGFGPALLDRAVLDALARALGAGFADIVRANLAGIEAACLAPDLAGFDLDAFLASLRPPARIHARHTVGLIDALDDGDAGARPGDGLPETLADAIEAYGHRYFKLKLGGDVDADLERLEAIAAVLDSRCPVYRVTLDGNEQYTSLEGVAALLDGVRHRERLATLREAVEMVEQPFARDLALTTDVAGIGPEAALIIDESDADMDAFPRARECGYRGVSSKACKGLYKSLLNAARCVHWNVDAGEPGRYFLSGEDLTCQAGLAVQQDLALAGLLGIEHVERNGHHYVHGMQGAPQAEQQAFLTAHPDLYRRHGPTTCLRIEEGTVALGSLWGTGFASAAVPEWSAMREMALTPGGP